MVFSQHRYGILLALVLILSLTFVALREIQTSDNTPIRIGLAVNLSGQGGTVGEYIREGAQLTVKEMHAAVGIKGRPLELSVVDDRHTRKGGDLVWDKKLLLARVSPFSASLLPLRHSLHILLRTHELC